MDLKVTIQGIAGCFHDEAAREYFASAAPDAKVVPQPFETFPEMIRALDADPELRGIMAIENTIAGALLQNHELLRQSNLHIVGEYKKRISHSLAVRPGADPTKVQAVLSHPMALMQCDKFLEAHPGMKPVEWFDTAGAARDVAAGEDTMRAAICPHLAAEIYGLEVVEAGIETNKRNFTRFLILEHNDAPDRMPRISSKINKASIVFALPHTQGALSKVLAILSFYDMNLTKIQSMPILGREWEYRFYIDLAFSDRERFHQSITAIRPLLNDFRMLGEYEACEAEV